MSSDYYTNTIIGRKTNPNFVDPENIIIPSSLITAITSPFIITSTTVGNLIIQIGTVKLKPKPTITNIINTITIPISYNTVLNMSIQNNILLFTVTSEFQFIGNANTLFNSSNNTYNYTTSLGFFISATFKSINNFSVILSNSGNPKGEFQVIGNFNVYGLFNNSNGIYNFPLNTIAEITYENLTAVATNRNIQTYQIQYSSILTGNLSYTYTSLNNSIVLTSCSIKDQLFIPTQTFFTIILKTGTEANIAINSILSNAQKISQESTKNAINTTDLKPLISSTGFDNSANMFSVVAYLLPQVNNLN